MSARMRGQEVTLRTSIDGQVQGGSFLKCKEFTATPRTTLTEEGYLGESEDDLDIQHHGWDLAFALDVEDHTTFDFTETYINREQLGLQHPRITITAIHVFREPGAQNRIEVFHRVFLKTNEHGFGGRKEYVGCSFEGKCKRRSLLTA